MIIINESQLHVQLLTRSHMSVAKSSNLPPKSLSSPLYLKWKS